MHDVRLVCRKFTLTPQLVAKLARVSAEKAQSARQCSLLFIFYTRASLTPDIGARKASTGTHVSSRSATVMCEDEQYPVQSDAQLKKKAKQALKKKRQKAKKRAAGQCVPKQRVPLDASFSLDLDAAVFLTQFCDASQVRSLCHLTRDRLRRTVIGGCTAGELSSKIRPRPHAGHTWRPRGPGCVGIPCTRDRGRSTPVARCPHIGPVSCPPQIME